MVKLEVLHRRRNVTDVGIDGTKIEGGLKARVAAAAEKNSAAGDAAKSAE